MRWCTRAAGVSVYRNGRGVGQCRGGGARQCSLSVPLGRVPFSTMAFSGTSSWAAARAPAAAGCTRIRMARTGQTGLARPSRSSSSPPSAARPFMHAREAAVLQRPIQNPWRRPTSARRSSLEWPKAWGLCARGVVCTRGDERSDRGGFDD